MNALANPFDTINLSAPAENPAAVYSPSRPPGDVAAGPIESPSNKGGHQEAPTVAVPSAATAGLLDSQIDWDALYDAIVPPEPPMFLRAPSRGYLDGLFELGGA